MRSVRLALAAMLAIALTGAGCYESLTSIVTADTVVFYDGLVGEYRFADPGTGRVRIVKGERKGYTFEQFDENDKPTNKGTLHVIKLGRDHFYELAIDGFRTDGGKPMYAIGRLAIERDDEQADAKSLTGFAFKSKEKFFADPEITTVEYAYDDRGERKTSRGLSMPPERLQAYLAAHVDEMVDAQLRLERIAKAR